MNIRQDASPALRLAEDAASLSHTARTKPSRRLSARVNSLRQAE
jgi:hypothetical protein